MESAFICLAVETFTPLSRKKDAVQWGDCLKATEFITGIACSSSIGRVSSSSYDNMATAQTRHRRPLDGRRNLIRVSII